MNLEAKIQKLDTTLERQKMKLQSLQQRRLFWGLGVFVLLLISQIFKGYFLEWAAILIALPFFLFEFKKSRNLEAFIKKMTDLKSFYNHQLQFTQGQAFPKSSLKNVESPLIRDLDLDELFAALDMSYSQEGETLLASWLGQSFTQTTRDQRQKWIQELAQYPSLLRRVHSYQPERKLNFSILNKELQRTFLESNPIWKWLIPISWALLFPAIILSPDTLLWKALLLIYMGASLFYLGITQNLFSRLQDLMTELELLKTPLNPVVRLSQKLTFTPELSKEQPENDIKTLSRMVSLVSFKANPIIFYLLNIIAPWNFIITEFSEKKRKEISKHFSVWSQEAILLEALSSLAQLKIYHDTQWATPHPQNQLQFKKISHPLLDQRNVIKNDFQPESQKSIFIITGSNMSGKSTFLRALGINFCLAQIGAPVFADEFQFPDFRIQSCIRVSDSLRDGQSYFYAEVKRMKHVLEEAKKSPILFLIDEPLRGTNNKERLEGNQAYLKQIIATGSMGFVSTHDLELTKLSEISETVDNYHFTEDWRQKDLFFNYLIQDGPSKSTNALKILEREGLFSQV